MTEREIIPAHDLKPCPECNRLELWWDAKDTQRCLHCDPPPRLRQAKPRKATP